MTGKMYSTVLLALINFSVFKITFCENVELRSEVELDKSETTADFQYQSMTGFSLMARPVNKAQIQDTRFRRAPSQCTGNDTIFENLASYYMVAFKN